MNTVVKVRICRNKNTGQWSMSCKVCGKDTCLKSWQTAIWLADHHLTTRHKGQHAYYGSLDSLTHRSHSHTALESQSMRIDRTRPPEATFTVSMRQNELDALADMLANWSLYVLAATPNKVVNNVQELLTGLTVSPTPTSAIAVSKTDPGNVVR